MARTRITPERFKDIANDAGFRVGSYSGRGMMGERCLAITPKDNVSSHGVIAEMMKVCAFDEGYLIGPEVEDLCSIFRGTKTDSMGRGVVLYWPDLEWPFDWTEDPDDDEEDS